MAEFYLIFVASVCFGCVSTYRFKRDSSFVLLECKDGLTLCHDGKQCVQKQKLCDGHYDCPDKSDESFCGDGNCTASEFRCRSGDCVSRFQVCDRLHDCHDGSDEIICDPADVCEHFPDKFLCADRKQCITQVLLCDGNVDCADNSDEGNLCVEAKSACNSKSCDQICIPTPDGAVCHCKDGYFLSSNTTCTDIDECNHGNGMLCSQHCINYPGGYNCTCSSGYNLQDASVCKAEGSEPLILVASYSQIIGLYPQSNRTVKIQSYLSSVMALAYGQEEMLYWTDVDEKLVYGTRLEGHETHRENVIIDTGLETPEGIVVDWSTGHLYITDNKRILVCPPDGRSCAILIDNLTHPRAVTIDMATQTLFWSDLGHSVVIEKSWLNGENRMVLVNTTIGQPNRLVVDSVLKYIYWTDSVLKRIERIKFDGSEREVLISRMLDHPFGIAVFEDRVYWTDLKKGTLSSINKQSKGDVKLEMRNVLHPTDIIVIQPALYQTQQSGSPCMSNVCGDICLPSKKRHGFSCTCTPDKVLDLDGVKCHRNPNFTQLLIGAPHEIIQIPLSNIGNKNEMSHSVTFDKLKNPFSIAVDLHENSLVYSDVKRDVIAKFFIDQSDLGEMILFEDLHTVDDIVVDISTGNIFWVDTGKSTIEVGSADGKYHIVLVNDKIKIPRPNSLDIDVAHGYLYFSDIGPSPYIGFCHMDGTNCGPLYLSVGRPNDITLDHSTSRVYFTDDDSRKIISIRVPDVDQRRVHWHDTAGRPYSLAVDSEWLYWTDLDKDRVFKINKTFSHNPDLYVLLQDISDMRGITLLDHKNVMAGVSPCGKNNGGCSQLCLPNPDGRLCRCTDGWSVDDDGKTCVKDVHLSPVNCTEGSEGCTRRIKVLTEDCPIGSKDCVQQTISSECIRDDRRGYMCNSGECIRHQDVCDNVSHCLDSSDEGAFCDSACQNQTVCQQDCIPSPHGPICICYHGYKWRSDLMTCVDINECEDKNGGCSQICINTEGSHMCKCAKEYIQSSQHTNKCIIHDPRPYLVISTTDGLTKLQDNGQSVPLDIGKVAGQVSAIDVVMDTGNIFFSTIDNLHSSLYKFDVTSRNITMVTEEYGYLADIAYDWLGNNMYLANDKRISLSVCSVKMVSSVSCKDLLFVKIKSIAIDPIKGLLFWINMEKRSIFMSWMDGQNIKSVITSDLISPETISIDYPAERLYWIDAGHSTIETSTFDGTDRYIVLELRNYYHFTTIDVFEDVIYATDWRSSSTYQCDKFGNGAPKKILQNLHTPTSVKVVHPLKYNRGPSPCENLKCSHICLLTPTVPHCECPNGYQFLTNSSNICTDELLKPSSTSTINTTSTSSKESDASSGHNLREDEKENSDSVCPLPCLNGGTCRKVRGQHQPYCVCQLDYSGKYCENKITESEKTSENSQHHWVAGVIIGIIIIIVLIIAMLYCYRMTRKEQNLQTYLAHLNCQAKSQTCHSADDQDLVSELSFASTNLAFGNPAFLEEEEEDFPVLREKKSKWYAPSPLSSSSDTRVLISSNRTDSGHSSPDTINSSRSSSSCSGPL